MKVARKGDPERLVYVAEMGANTSLCPLYAWSPRGERAHVRVPRNQGKNTTLLASMGIEGMGSCLAVEGTTTAAVFEIYVEWVLALSLRSGQLVVIDNRAAHKGQRINELIEAMGGAICAVTDRDARGFFEHCGPHLPVSTVMTNTVEAAIAVVLICDYPNEGSRQQYALNVAGFLLRWLD